MRLWTIHPRYLDRQGLVALWREALLAQAVLLGETRGYTRHPQLSRFRSLRSPIAGIATYLESVHAESVARGYHFFEIIPGKARDWEKGRVSNTAGTHRRMGASGGILPNGHGGRSN